MTLGIKIQPRGELPVLCNIHRPWGGAEVEDNVPCAIYPRIAGQRIGGNPPPMYYTHYVHFSAATDVRDASVRQTNQSQQAFGATGDELRIPATAGYTRFIVTMVEMVNRGTPYEFKRAFVSRDAVQWTGGDAP